MLELSKDKKPSNLQWADGIDKLPTSDSKLLYGASYLTTDCHKRIHPGTFAKLDAAGHDFGVTILFWQNHTENYTGLSPSLTGGGELRCSSKVVIAVFLLST